MMRGPSISVNVMCILAWASLSVYLTCLAISAVEHLGDAGEGGTLTSDVVMREHQ